MEELLLEFASLYTSTAKKLKKQIDKLIWIQAIHTSGDWSFANDEILDYLSKTRVEINKLSYVSVFDVKTVKTNINKTITSEHELLRLRACALVIVLRLAAKGKIQQAFFLLNMYCSINDQYSIAIE